MDNSLEGKIIIVTGGARDIGRAISLAFGSRGASVAVNYHRSENMANETVQEIENRDGKAVALKADVSKWEQVQRLVSETLDAFENRVDILINNAGGYVDTMPVVDADETLWDRVMELNAKSTYLMCKAVIPHMPAGGNIVNISSLAARTGGGPGRVLYATSKGAVSSFTKGLAKEMAPRGIRVNCIEPGFIDTRFHASLAPEKRIQRGKSNLIGRFGQAEDVAGAVIYLATDAASFLTGTSIQVNGGVHFI
jgi:3-oxoacyl-[acyl-carrier protein] reductase